MESHVKWYTALCISSVYSILYALYIATGKSYTCCFCGIIFFSSDKVKKVLFKILDCFFHLCLSYVFVLKYKTKIRFYYYMFQYLDFLIVLCIHCLLSLQFAKLFNYLSV